MTLLNDVLNHIGYSERAQQSALFKELCSTDENGIVAQAGTGTGKSLAVLAAGVHWKQQTGLPTVVVCPTNILMDQYVNKDAVMVAEALDVIIKSLKGRNRYLCESAPGFSGLTRAPVEVIEQEVEMTQHLIDPDEIFEPENTYWFGCPGGDECDREKTCHYRRARAALEDADIIITNAHLLILNDQLLAKEPIEKTNEDGEQSTFQPRIFPDFGALFVDEAHTFEDVLRGFATRAINSNSVEDMASGNLAYWLRQQRTKHKFAAQVAANAELVSLLRDVSKWTPDEGQKAKKYQLEAKEAAKYIIDRGKADAYANAEAVLWFDPRDRDLPPRLVSTQINLAGGARRILTKQPFGLVSGTIPRTLRSALGVNEASFIDVGHPFDYGKQATLKISPWSGAYQAAQQPQNIQARHAELLLAVGQAGGGALLLFSSYRDMEAAYEQTKKSLQALSLDVRMQSREGDKNELGQWFKSHGNAVLFATESFATGFDVPGDALRLVGIWKLPYPGMDPVTNAIKARDYRRYEDMMLMKVTQAVGRLIRTVDDRGTVHIFDSRAADKLLYKEDPMIAHLTAFQREDRPVREEY